MPYIITLKFLIKPLIKWLKTPFLIPSNRMPLINLYKHIDTIKQLQQHILDIKSSHDDLCLKQQDQIQ